VTDFTFLIRFRLPDDRRLGFDAPRLDLPVSNLPASVTLSTSGGIAIKDSGELAVRCRGFATAEEASAAGGRCLDALSLCFTRLGFGVDFGTRRLHGVITDYGLARMSEAAGSRLLRGDLGLAVFESDPEPRFVTMGGRGCGTCSGGRVEQSIAHALAHPVELSDKERLAHELYAASFFETTPHVRFLLLVMAVEAMLEPAPRSQAALAHVETLIDFTEGAGLSRQEKDSIVGSLRWLRQESINQAGRRLASERLGEREYQGRKAEAFFTRCYGLRSRMVHGTDHQPTLAEVSQAAGEIGRFVADLLTAPYTVPDD
jgi:hypothetical protein